jgi:hypothetical protein
MIDRHEASDALVEIAAIAKKVRQSTIYRTASANLIMWGILVFAGYVASYLAPRAAIWIWIAITVIGITGWIVLAAWKRQRAKVESFNARLLIAVLLFLAFGVFTILLGHFGPRQIAAFWPIYFMLVYTIVGLWTGTAFVVIGLSITALTLFGYVVIGDAFSLWMAFVDGGGLLLGGLWMRRDQV